jgi:hypothetical protein
MNLHREVIHRHKEAIRRRLDVADMVVSAAEISGLVADFWHQQAEVLAKARLLDCFKDLVLNLPLDISNLGSVYLYLVT